MYKGDVFHPYLRFLCLLQGSELVKVKLFIFIAISKTNGLISNALWPFGTPAEWYAKNSISKLALTVGSEELPGVMLTI